MLVHVLLAAFAALAIAKDANFTLDDKDNALLYHPSTAWLQLSRPCSAPSCSWHQALPDSDATLQLSFVGTALYLFSVPSPLFHNLSFFLDDRPLPPCAQTPTDPLVLALNGLSNTRHDFRVAVEPNSTFLFDYLVYTIQEPTLTLRIQPRQQSDNPLQNQTETPSSIPSTSPQEQIGAIAGAIAAAVGITALFSIGLAISIVKIRRQRLRNRAERQAELERTQGLSLHLPSASVSAAARVPLPRYTHPPPDPTAVLDPPPMYDSVMRLTSRNATVLAQLPPIDEVATIRSSQASRLSRREPSLIDSVPGNPPGLSTVADHPSEETIRASQDPSCPSEHHHQE